MNRPVETPLPARRGVTHPGAERERRAARRVTLLIRTGKIIAGSREYLCIVRNASSGGLSARIFHPLPEGVPLEIELSNGERCPIEQIWHDRDSAGFRFLETVDIERLIAQVPDTLRRRSLPLNVAIPAVLTVHERPHAITFREISQHGACIACSEYLALDERVQIDSEWLPPIFAHVRWRQQPHYGVVFEQSFRFDELARLTAELQDQLAAEEDDEEPPRFAHG